MVKAGTRAVGSRARRAWPILTVLLWTALGLGTPAAALNVTASSDDTPLAGGASLVTVTWQAELGPVRTLGVSSPIGRFDGEVRDTFGGMLERKNVSGRVVFMEVVRVPARVTLAALEAGAPVVLRRRFEVARVNGAPESATATLRLAVPAPRVALRVRPPSHRASLCASERLTFRWTVTTENVAPLEVESAGGTLVADGREIAFVESPLAGLATGRLDLSETFDAFPEALRGALAGREIVEYRRRFVARGGGLERTLADSVTVELPDGGIAVTVTVTSTPTSLALERSNVVALRWRATGSAPCLELVSSEVRATTASGRVLATLPRPLRFAAAGGTTEHLTLPAAFVQSLLDRGETEVLLARDLEIRVPGASGDEAQPRVLRRSVRLPWAGLGEDAAIARLALFFEGGEVFRRVPRGAPLTAIAEVTTSGQGPIRGIWEVADPASALGRPVFRPLRVVAKPASLDGTTRFVLPDLPTDQPGPHVLRLRLASPRLLGEEPVLRYEVHLQWRPEPTAEPVDSGLGAPPEPVPLEEGDPVEEREILVLVAGEAAAKKVADLGLEVKMRYRLETRWPLETGEPLVLTVLRTPAGVAVAEVLRQIRRQHPRLWVDANDLYLPQGEGDEPLSPEVLKSLARHWQTEFGKCRKRVRTLGPEQCGIVDAGSHLRNLKQALREILPDSDCTAISRGFADDEPGGGFLPESISALEVTLGLEELIGMPYVLIGVSGRSNWILRIFVFAGAKSGSLFLAPFHNECLPRNSFPATSPYARGVLAVTQDRSGALKGCGSSEVQDLLEVAGGDDHYAIELSTVNVRLPNAPGNSYGVPFLAAAFHVLGENAPNWSPAGNGGTWPPDLRVFQPCSP